MSYRIEYIPAEYVPGLRAGYAFSVWKGFDLVTDGRIKPSGAVILAEGSPMPEGDAFRHVAESAARYAAEGTPPCDAELDGAQAQEEE